MARLTNFLQCLHSLLTSIPQQSYYNFSRVVQPQIRTVGECLERMVGSGSAGKGKHRAALVASSKVAHHSHQQQLSAKGKKISFTAPTGKTFHTFAAATAAADAGVLKH